LCTGHLVCVVALTWWAVLAHALPKTDIVSLSPFNQHLPNCKTAAPIETKKMANIKAIACPMVRDEIGFMSEW
jgi:hypothetical protein